MCIVRLRLTIIILLQVTCSVHYVPGVIGSGEKKIIVAILVWYLCTRLLCKINKQGTSHLLTNINFGSLAVYLIMGPG